MLRYRKSRGELDKLLCSLNYDEVPMTLCEFDGYATGILACPESISVSEWFPCVLGYREREQFPDQKAAEAAMKVILSYFVEMKHQMSETGSVSPVFQDNSLFNCKLWEPWIDGYIRATALRPIVWQEFYERSDEDMQCLMVFIQNLHDIYTGRSKLSAVQIKEIDDVASEMIASSVTHIMKSSRPERLLPKQRKRFSISVKSKLVKHINGSFK